jgi:type IV pilus assembly protein PilC
MLYMFPSRMEDLALFARHISGAMNARAPLPEILRAYVRDSERGSLTKKVEKMIPRIETGVALSEAMGEHPDVFPTAIRQLVALGEQTKTLGGIMGQVAGNLERSLKTYEYFRRVALYPLFILILLFVIISVMFVKIIPTFDQIFADMGAQLPWITKTIVEGPAMQIFSLVIIPPIIFFLLTFFGLWVKGLGYGRFALNFPFIGPILRRAETALFAGNLALLLQNRIPLSEALGLMIDSSSNSYIRAAIQHLNERCREGEALGSLMAAQPLFPPGMATLIASAEERGGLVETLESMSEFYTDRASHGLTVLREIFEPMMLLLVGLLVGVTMLAIYLPLFMLPHLIPAE